MTMSEAKDVPRMVDIYSLRTDQALFLHEYANGDMRIRFLDEGDGKVNAKTTDIRVPKKVRAWLGVRLRKGDLS